MSDPIRVQRSRAKGWRMPENTVSVARPSVWGNPYALGTKRALARVPALDGSPWEYEGRISAHGMRHDYHHPGGAITVHHIRYMTRIEVVELYRTALLNPTPQIHLSWRAFKGARPMTLTVEHVRSALTGKNLACFCPIFEPCHADVLLEVANRGDHE